MLIGVAESVGRGGTASGDHVTISAQAEAHADLARDRSHSSAGNAEQTDLLFLAAMPQAVHLLGKLLRSAAGPKNDPDLTFLLDRH